MEMKQISLATKRTAASVQTLSAPASLVARGNVEA